MANKTILELKVGDLVKLYEGHSLEKILGAGVIINKWNNPHEFRYSVCWQRMLHGCYVLNSAEHELVKLA